MMKHSARRWARRGFLIRLNLTATSTTLCVRLASPLPRSFTLQDALSTSASNNRVFFTSRHSSVVPGHVTSRGRIQLVLVRLETTPVSAARCTSTSHLGRVTSASLVLSHASTHLHSRPKTHLRPQLCEVQRIQFRSSSHSYGHSELISEFSLDYHSPLNVIVIAGSWFGSGHDYNALESYPWLSGMIWSASFLPVDYICVIYTTLFTNIHGSRNKKNNMRAVI